MYFSVVYTGIVNAGDPGVCIPFRGWGSGLFTDRYLSELLID